MAVRALVLAVLFAALAASASAASSGPLGRSGQHDGIFAVTDGRGFFQLQSMQGSVFGRVDRGTVTLSDPFPANGATTIVRGYQTIKILSATKTVYCCKNIRFRTAGTFGLQIAQGVGVQISVVGHGKAIMQGAGYSELGLSDGTYQLNDSPEVPVPDVRTVVQIKSPMPPPPPKRRGP